MSEASKKEDNGSLPTASKETTEAAGQELGPSDAAATETDQRSDFKIEREVSEPQNPDASTVVALPDPTQEPPMIRHVYHPTHGGFSNYQRPSVINTISIVESISSHSYNMWPAPYQFPPMPFMNFMPHPMMNMGVPMHNTMPMGPGIPNFAADFQPSARFTQVFPTPPVPPHFYDQLQMEYQLLSEHFNATYVQGYPHPPSVSFEDFCNYSATLVVSSSTWFSHSQGFRPPRNKGRKGTGSSKQNFASRGGSCSSQFANFTLAGPGWGGNPSSFMGTYSTPRSNYRQTHELIVNPVPWVASDTLTSTSGRRMRASSSAARSTSEVTEPPSNPDETYETSFPLLGEDRRGKKGKHSKGRQKGSTSSQMPSTDPQSTECSANTSTAGNDKKTMTAIKPEDLPDPCEQLPPEPVGTFERSWADVAAGVLAIGPSISLGLDLDFPGPSSTQQESNATFQELQEDSTEYAYELDIELLQNGIRNVRQMIQEDMEQQLEQNARRNALRLLDELEEEQDQSNGNNQIGEIDEE